MVQLLIGAALAAVLVPWILTNQWKRSSTRPRRARSGTASLRARSKHAVWAVAAAIPAGILIFFLVREAAVPTPWSTSVDGPRHWR